MSPGKPACLLGSDHIAAFHVSGGRLAHFRTHREQGVESEDFAKALGQFSQSQEDFDLWFKEHVLALSGLDLNNPPEMELPEVLSTYISEQAKVPG